MITLNYSIEGEQQLLRRFHKIESNLSDWKPAFKEATEKLQGIFSNDVFNTQGKAIGENWQQLDPEYARWKSMRYPGKGPLERTGKMRQSFTRLFTPTSGAVWNTASYFKYHQSNQARSKIPRRVMMKLGNQQREIVVKIFQAYLFKKLK